MQALEDVKTYVEQESGVNGVSQLRFNVSGRRALDVAVELQATV